MERDTRFELAPSAWKADMLAARHQSRKYRSLLRQLSDRKEMITPQGRRDCDYSQLVRVAGLEPARAEAQQILSLWCLPIPPYPHIYKAQN